MTTPTTGPGLGSAYLWPSQTWCFGRSHHWFSYAYITRGTADTRRSDSPVWEALTRAVAPPVVADTPVAAPTRTSTALPPDSRCPVLYTTSRPITRPTSERQGVWELLLCCQTVYPTHLPIKRLVFGYYLNLYFIIRLICYKKVLISISLTLYK